MFFTEHSIGLVILVCQGEPASQDHNLSVVQLPEKPKDPFRFGLVQLVGGDSAGDDIRDVFQPFL